MWVMWCDVDVECAKFPKLKSRCENLNSCESSNLEIESIVKTFDQEGNFNPGEFQMFY